jgi:DNA invertase Pin-like site-specific DNA recombinase
LNTSRKKSRTASLRIELPSSGPSIEDGRVDVVVVYKINRLSRSLMDFLKLVEVFDRNNGTFVSVTGYAGEHQLLIDQKNCYRVHSIIQEPRPTSAGSCA